MPTRGQHPSVLPAMQGPEELRVRAVVAPDLAVGPAQMQARLQALEHAADAVGPPAVDDGVGQVRAQPPPRHARLVDHGRTFPT